MLENWTHAALLENLNTTFRLRHEQWGIVELKLLSVSDLKKTSRQEMYSILFCGPLDQPFGQGMFTTEHARLGTVALFLVPVGREKDGMRYEAVFNRLVKQNS